MQRSLSAGKCVEANEFTLLFAKDWFLLAFANVLGEIQLRSNNFDLISKWYITNDHVMQEYPQGPDGGWSCIVPMETEPLRRAIRPSTWNKKVDVCMNRK